MSRNIKISHMSEKSLGQRIKSRRREMKLSQKSLGKAAGVSESSISLWEGGNTAPRGENLHNLARALQCSPTWILFGDEDKAPGEPIPDDAPPVLTEDEQEILNLYRALPNSEQSTQIEQMRMKVNHFNRLFSEMLEARGRIEKAHSKAQQRKKRT